MEDQLKISFNSSENPYKVDSLPYIGVFGRKNHGKSSFINALSGVDDAETSTHSGTTKEPFKYVAELDEIGPVILIDTSGIDDFGEGGEKRINKTLETLKIIDIAVLLITGNLFAESEKKLVTKFCEFSIPFIVVHNKSDLQELSPITKRQVETAYQTRLVEFSCYSKPDYTDLIAAIKEFIPASAFESKSIIGNLFNKNDMVVLAIPDHINAPDGQLTKPQIEITRDLIENYCITLFVKQSELPELLKMISPKPKLTILPTISFRKSEEFLPANMKLTSYGVVMARYKGNFNTYISDTPKLSLLKDDDHVLIIQASTDNTSPEYKEQYKLQRTIDDAVCKKIDYTIVNIFEKPPLGITHYNFVVICGSFLLTRKQIAETLSPYIQSGIPVSSFDMVNAFICGIFDRATAPFINS